MLPLLMFRPRHALPRPVPHPHRSGVLLSPISVAPLCKNAPISPLLATLTDSVNHKSFVWHFCENTRDTPFQPESSLALFVQSSLTPLEFALPKNGPITRLESALTKKGEGWGSYC